MVQAGSKIGPYTLVRKLGRGSFGVVWLAERRSAIITTYVALKMALDDDVDLDMIRQEASVWLQASGHPNVLPLLEADVYDGQVVIVSEYAPDGSLHSWLERMQNNASVESAVEMTSGILSGLEHLHLRAIIHRDLKPANVLLQGDTPRLADFGIARILKTERQSGVIAGTPSYMAPEVFDGVRSEKGDIWSAGVLLYQMLSGRLPFPQAEMSSLMGAIIRQDPQPLPTAVPSFLAQVVQRALMKDATRRFATAGEMRAALRAAYEQSKWTGLLGPSETRESVQSTIVIGSSPSTSGFPAVSPPGSGPTGGDTKTGPPSPPVRRSVELSVFSFETVALNARGECVDRRTAQAQSFTADIDGALEMIAIPGGEFVMGSPDAEPKRDTDEGPTHAVRVAPFFMSRFPITQAQWLAATRLPKVHRDLDPDPSGFKGAELPVEQVSWEEAIEFCARLTQFQSRVVYRLPTEAEWEYACRAGTNTPFSYGPTVTADLVNYNGKYPYGAAPRGEYRQMTTPVGRLGPPNGFGLSDMHGNVWEWCLDTYQDSYVGAPSDGSAWIQSGNAYRVLRGGSWFSFVNTCRSANRERKTPELKLHSLGFRVAAILR
jgi:formylglycine-generating enzyme required for sulfatase activity